MVEWSKALFFISCSAQRKDSYFALQLYIFFALYYSLLQKHHRKYLAFSGSVAPMPGMHRPAGQTAAVGPAVPPRVQDSQQDRVLSVSGKKKCSACKAELGKSAKNVIFNA